MRLVLQRVHEAEVHAGGQSVGRIGRGLLLFLGVEQGDTETERQWLVDKVARLRCFEDAEGRMNHSLLDIGGEAMVISQFTLFGSLRKGTRPSFNRAADPELARAQYEAFARELAEPLGQPVPTGAFGQHMDIRAYNDGPVTLILDTRQKAF